jgi:hypothetical protein
MATSIEIVELWCSDCAGDVSFETVLVDSDTRPREWACITCGAAYIEAFEPVVEAPTQVRGVA